MPSTTQTPREVSQLARCLAFMDLFDELCWLNVKQYENIFSFQEHFYGGRVELGNTGKKILYLVGQWNHHSDGKLTQS